MVFNEVEMDDQVILRLRLRTTAAISRPRKKTGTLRSQQDRFFMM